MDQVIDRGPGHVRVGRLLVAWPVRQGRGTTLLDGCTTHLERRDEGEAVERVAFGGVAIRPPWRTNAVAVTWRGARVRNPGRWLSWPFLKARARWVMAGRPTAKPMTVLGGEYVAHAGRPEDVA